MLSEAGLIAHNRGDHGGYEMLQISAHRRVHDWM
jgi:hypothetical protein